MTASTPIDVESLDATASEDAGLIDRLTNLVNDVYAVAEDGLWQPGATRTTSVEMSSLVAAGEILIATRSGEGILGMVWSHDVEPDASEFGLLVSACERRHLGVGRKLVDEVERRSRDRDQRAIQLELLVPIGWRHPEQGVPRRVVRPLRLPTGRRQVHGRQLPRHGAPARDPVRARSPSQKFR